MILLEDPVKVRVREIVFENWGYLPNNSFIDSENNLHFWLINAKGGYILNWVIAPWQNTMNNIQLERWLLDNVMEIRI